MSGGLSLTLPDQPRLARTLPAARTCWSRDETSMAAATGDDTFAPVVVCTCRPQHEPEADTGHGNRGADLRSSNALPPLLRSSQGDFLSVHHLYTVP